MGFFEAELLALSEPEFWIGIVVASGISLWAFRAMYKSYQNARTIENVPTAKVRSAAQGYVELIGQAKMMEGPIITSPLSRKTCVWFRYKIEEKVTEHTNNGTRTKWKVIKQETSDEIFMLEDETGRCVIDPDKAEVIVTDKRVWHDHQLISQRRYTEELITEREQLYAIGLFKSVAHVQHNKEREHVMHLLREWKKDYALLVENYDSNNDGRIDMQEWEQVRADAQKQVKQDFGERSKQEQLSVLSYSPHKDQAFILSTVPESELVNKYKGRALLGMLGFLGLGSLVVWALNIRILL
jgi:hypothetical protein